MNDYILIGCAVWVVLAVIAAGIKLHLAGRRDLAAAVDSFAMCLLWPGLIAVMPVVIVVSLLSYAVLGVATIIDRLT